MSEKEGGQFRQLMGKRIKDSYGRYAGFVVGISTDPFGEIKGIAIDSGQEGLVEIPRESMHQDGDFMILTPQWKMDADKFRNENNLVKSRAMAVEELLKEGEITEDEVGGDRRDLVEPRFPELALNVEFFGRVDDFGATLVAKALGDLVDLVLDNLHLPLVAGEDGELRD